MSLVIVKQHEMPVDGITGNTSSANWFGWLHRWVTAENRLRKQWNYTGLTSSGRRVPYRVWRRHGAYLDLQRRAGKH